MFSEFSKGNKFVRHLNLDLKPTILDRLQFMDDLQVMNAERREQKKLVLQIELHPFLTILDNDGTNCGKEIKNIE